MPSENGARGMPTSSQDVVKVAVIARHGKNDNIGLGFVKGFGLKRGAIASSVGHDSHNICVVGVDDADMAAGRQPHHRDAGRLCGRRGGEVLAELPLPVAGLMSEEPFEAVRDALDRAARGRQEPRLQLAEPFLQVAFLPLPVIPHLKITDLGLFDVNRMELL